MARSHSEVVLFPLETSIGLEDIVGAVACSDRLYEVYITSRAEKHAHTHTHNIVCT